MHHTRGIHAYNYGLPRWDAIFGTRRNPERWEAEYGFWDGASSELGPMLLGRDIGDAPADAARSCAEGAPLDAGPKRARAGRRARRRRSILCVLRRVTASSGTRR